MYGAIRLDMGSIFYIKIHDTSIAHNKNYGHHDNDYFKLLLLCTSLKYKRTIKHDVTHV